MSDVEVLLTVGKLDASLALLTTQDHHVIEFPTMLLPDNVKAGSIVKLSVSQNSEEEKRQLRLFRDIQTKILEKYGIEKPKAPILKIVNVTQTSCVLAWDPLSLGSARLKSLILYRQGVRSMVIPSPLKTIMTKISGLSIDTDYEFQLKLSTTSGQYWSEKVKMHTHKMTDMSGITVCLGSLDPSQNISGEQIAESLQKVGARQMQKHTAIDTTHFVTNDTDNDDDPELVRAKSSNIPIVRPEWVRACEVEKRIVGVRGFYLDADPGILKSYQFPKANGSKVKFANEAETIDDKKQEAERESEGEEDTEQKNEDPRKDNSEVNPESTDVQEEAGLGKLKEANEATTETTMELKDDATQSDQNISAPKNDEGSTLAQEGRGVENSTTEIHQKSEGLPISVETTDSKAQEKEEIKSKVDSPEDNEAVKSEEASFHPDVEKRLDNEAVKSEEASFHPDVEKRLDTGEETLEITSEDIKDEANESKTEKTEHPSVPAPAPVPEEQPDIKEETLVNGPIEAENKTPEEHGEAAVSDSEKRVNTEEETLEDRPEDNKDGIRESEQEKVEDSSIPVPVTVPEEQPDIKEETFVNGSIGTKDEMPEEHGEAAVSDSEKRVNAKEETLEVRPEDNKDGIRESEQEKVEDSSIPAPATAPEEQPDIKEETFVNGSIGTKDKMPKEDAETVVFASEKQLDPGEENRPGDIHTDIIESNVEKVNAENEKAAKGQEPEENRDLERSKESYPETKQSEGGETQPSEIANQEEKPSEIGETRPSEVVGLEEKPSETGGIHPSEVVNQGEQRDESYVEEPAETNFSQVPDTSHDSESNAEGKEATPESSSSQPKNVGSGKKNKKKNKNKKK